MANIGMSIQMNTYWNVCFAFRMELAHVASLYLRKCGWGKSYSAKETKTFVGLEMFRFPMDGLRFTFLLMQVFRWTTAEKWVTFDLWRFSSPLMGHFQYRISRNHFSPLLVMNMNADSIYNLDLVFVQAANTQCKSHRQKYGIFPTFHFKKSLKAFKSFSTIERQHLN